MLISAPGREEVIVASDSRSDTVGHSAMRGTCSLLGTKSSTWLTLLYGDFREIDIKAPNLEKSKFKEGLLYLKSNLNVKEVVTDASPQIISLMSKYASSDKLMLNVVEN